MVSVVLTFALPIGPVDPSGVVGAAAAAALLPEGTPWVQSRPGPDGRERLFLARGESGGCVFLDPADGCRIHTRLGPEAKPAFCRVFPFDLVRDPAGAALVVRPGCAGHHRSAFDGERIDADLPGILALPHPDRAFAPPLVEVLPGAGITAEAWCRAEPGLLRLAAGAGGEPEAAVVAIRDALVRATGRVQPPPDARIAAAALVSVAEALAVAATQLRDTSTGPLPDLPARAVAGLAALARPPAPLAPDAEAWLSVVLRTLLLGKGFEPMGLPAALGLHLLDVAMVRRTTGPGADGTVDAAAASALLVPWWLFTANRAIRAVLAGRRAALAAIWTNTVA